MRRIRFGVNGWDFEKEVNYMKLLNGGITMQSFFDAGFDNAHILIDDEGEFWVSAYNSDTDHTAETEDMFIVGDLDYLDDIESFGELLEWVVRDSEHDDYPPYMTTEEVDELIEKVGQNEYFDK